MKAVIYLRTSTTEQNPKIQRSECEAFAQGRGYDVVQVFEEQASAYKQDAARPLYDRVKDIARRGETQAVIVWGLDRWVRNRDTLLEDISILRGYGCKLHSVKDAWLEAVNVEGALGRTIQDFLLGLLGSLAELESARKGERVRLAMRKETGSVTRSYKGKVWGRPDVMRKIRERVLELHGQGMTMRRISASVTYWDASRNERHPSPALVHKIIKQGVSVEGIVKPNVHEVTNS